MYHLAYIIPISNAHLQYLQYIQVLGQLISL